jgi:hypothetical protein
VPLGSLLSFVQVTITLPVLCLSLGFVLFLVLRRERLAREVDWLFYVALYAVPLLGPSRTGNALTVFWSGLRVGLQIFVLARFGLLPFAASVMARALSECV